MATLNWRESEYQAHNSTRSASSKKYISYIDYAQTTIPLLTFTMYKNDNPIIYFYNAQTTIPLFTVTMCKR